MIEEYRAQIERALVYSGGTHDFEDIVELVESGEAQFWPGEDSAVVTQVVEYPRAKQLHVWVAAGNLAGLEAMVPEIEAWAKEQGCTGATMIGRPGWERTFLARMGWKRTAVLMETQWQE